MFFWPSIEKVSSITVLGPATISGSGQTMKRTLFPEADPVNFV